MTFSLLHPLPFGTLTVGLPGRVFRCPPWVKRDRVKPTAGPAMSAMHPKATDTSLKTSYRDWLSTGDRLHGDPTAKRQAIFAAVREAYLPIGA